MGAGSARSRRRTAKEYGPDPVDVHAGQQLRLARTLAGMSQAEFARRLGMSFQLIQKYEQGEIRVSASRLYRMARLLGRDVDFFFAGLTGGEPNMLVQQELELVGAVRAIAPPEVRTQFLALLMDIAGRKPPGPKARRARGSGAKG